MKRPDTHHYGEWLVYFAHILRDSFVDSDRKYIGNLNRENIHIGVWKKPIRWPWVFITYVSHPVVGANVSGGQVNTMFTYDIIVENKGIDMDDAEIEGINILGDIIAILVVDQNLEVNYDGVREARGIQLDILNPQYSLSTNLRDQFVWAVLRVTIEKKLDLV